MEEILQIFDLSHTPRSSRPARSPRFEATRLNPASPIDESRRDTDVDLPLRRLSTPSRLRMMYHISGSARAVAVAAGGLLRSQLWIHMPTFCAEHICCLHIIGQRCRIALGRILINFAPQRCEVPTDGPRLQGKAHAACHRSQNFSDHLGILEVLFPSGDYCGAYQSWCLPTGSLIKIEARGGRVNLSTPVRQCVSSSRTERGFSALYSIMVRFSVCLNEGADPLAGNSPHPHI
jgi:hypothetical protein